jgi:hypothetical protein
VQLDCEQRTSKNRAQMQQHEEEQSWLVPRIEDRVRTEDARTEERADADMSRDEEDPRWAGRKAMTGRSASDGVGPPRGRMARRRDGPREREHGPRLSGRATADDA